MASVIPVASKVNRTIPLNTGNVLSASAFQQPRHQHPEHQAEAGPATTWVPRWRRAGSPGMFRVLDSGDGLRPDFDRRDRPSFTDSSTRRGGPQATHNHACELLAHSTPGPPLKSLRKTGAQSLRALTIPTETGLSFKKGFTEAESRVAMTRPQSARPTRLNPARQPGTWTTVRFSDSPRNQANHLPSGAKTQKTERTWSLFAN